MLQKINSQMSLGGRLSIISGVFAASSVFATGLFFNSAWTNIRFTNAERDGASALPDIWHAMGGGALPDDGDTLRVKFGAGDALEAFQGATEEGDRLQAGRGLISKVADGSNLTLDPDLDSFYVMDAVTVRLPKLRQTIFDLKSALSKPDASATETAVAFDRLNFAVAEAYGSLSLGIQSNKSGETGAAIGAQTEVLQTKAQTTIDLAKETAAGRGDRAARQGAATARRCRPR